MRNLDLEGRIGEKSQAGGKLRTVIDRLLMEGEASERRDSSKRSHKNRRMVYCRQKGLRGKVKQLWRLAENQED